MNKDMQMISSKPLSRWLGVVVVLQVLTLLTQWGTGPGASTVHAQIPDAGEQRNQLIEQARMTNDKLDKLLDVLKSGELQVKVVKPDDAKGHD